MPTFFLVMTFETLETLRPRVTQKPRIRLNVWTVDTLAGLHKMNIKQRDVNKQINLI